MLDSLYGDLPPSREESSNNSGSRNSAIPKSTSLLGSLYDDLDDTPGDDASPHPTTSVAAAINTTTTSADTSTSATNSSSSSSAPTGVVAPVLASSAWAAHRLQLLTPAVVRKQTLAAAAAAAKTTAVTPVNSSTSSGPTTAAATNTAAAGSIETLVGGSGGDRSVESSSSSTGDDSSNDTSNNSSKSRGIHAAAAAAAATATGDKGGNSTGGGTAVFNSNSKYSSIDVAAVAAAASAAAAAVAAQLKAVKTEAGLILSRGVTVAGAAPSCGTAAETTPSLKGGGRRGTVAAKGRTESEEEKKEEVDAVKTEHKKTGALAGTPQDEQQIKDALFTTGKTEEQEQKEEKNGFIFVGNMQDEYDPTAPNDYISVYRERIRKQQREELERLRQQELEKQRRERELALGGTGLPPLSGVAFGEGSGIGVGLPGQPGAAPGAAAAAPAPPTLPSYIDPAKKSFAARMMEKMGWKHGEGLGVNKQGITAPLVAKKTAMRSGVIVQGAEVVAAAAQARAAQFNRPPTRVLLLLNMVGRGEVDEDLKQETEEEAAKFGNLLQVRVIEAPDVPDEEAVRIFCEYERKEEATLAFLTMNGRVFGGRTVKSKFYCEDRWQKEDLLPNLEEEGDQKTE